MIGDYTEVVLTAPSSAQEGSTVNISVSIKNIMDYTIYAEPVVEINGSVLDGSYETLTPGETKSWPFSFVMPAASISITADGWCESAYFDWQKDISVEHVVNVTAVGAINLTDLVGMVAVVMMMTMMMKMMKGV